jgi:D-alanyl-D-alanine carboxypeptidase
MQPSETAQDNSPTRFMSLGSPRSITLPPPEKPSLHFTLIPERVFTAHSKWQYAAWITLALIIGISVASFVTESVLLAKDVLFSPSQTYAVSTTTPSRSSQPTPTQQEALGSDDASASSTASLINSLGQYRLANSDKFPKMNAESFLVGDIDTGEIIYEKNETQVAPIASVSKLMTATIAVEQLNPDQVAIVSRDSYETYGSEGGLLLGEKIRIHDLMYPLLIESSNDGAEVIADAYKGGHEGFILEMNKKAKLLGMDDTNYEDPSGLSEKNVSSVEDLFRLGRYIRINHPELWDISRIRQYAIYKHQWTNKNVLLQRDYFLGGKNGFIDQSRQTTVSLFEVPMANGIKRNIGIVILRSVNRTDDSLRIIDFLKKNAYFDVSPDTSTATTTAQ